MEIHNGIFQINGIDVHAKVCLSKREWHGSGKIKNLDSKKSKEFVNEFLNPSSQQQDYKTSIGSIFITNFTELNLEEKRVCFEFKGSSEFLGFKK